MVIIGYYDDSENAGGTTRYLHDLISAFDRNIIKTVIFSPRPRAWHDGFREYGTQIVTCRPNDKALDGASDSHEPVTDQNRGTANGGGHNRLPSGIAWTAGCVREIMKLASLFRRAKVDLLHLNNTGAEPAPIAARFAGCRHIVGTWHVDSTYDLDNLRGGLRYRVLEELSMRSLHRSIAVSMATKSDWLKRCRMEAYANRVTVIHNGIDPARVARMRTVEERRRELGIPADATVIGSLGRLDRAKGYEYLLQAMALFLRQLNNTHVVIGGSGPLVGSLTDLANELGISKRVHFLGHVADPRMVLNALDIYVQPSLCEAFPIALLEASAAGLPVVASDVGGIPESVLDGETGFVVPPKDPGSLAGSIEKLLADPQLRRAMGDAGVARTRREFSLDTMVRQTLEVYGSLLHMPELPATRITATPPDGVAPPAPGGEPSLMVSGGVSR